MKTGKFDRNRSKPTGRYSYTNPDRICTCGNRLGDHEAEWPHSNYDLMQGPTCAKFQPVKEGK